ncbi:tyrosine-type recombinase/integrase [Bacteroides xylanisolvens]|uniref:tyrosine-type recombinase/integrase n=1 Tax=Bacteroides xylanisolvens TaxID=371601 RepID=UPI002165741C|nr:tyrosine-type recombinase/integrase [Bacteroides xylanisolvens]MCS2626491.1 tyrosine-type recombinase/integrase [Bacteroides xylanisolvens]
MAYRRYSHAYIKEGDILTYFYKIIEKENQELPLTLEDIDKYIEYYTINKVQRNTLKEYLCCIRVYLRYAVEKGWCITDLDKALITPKVYSEENLPSFLPWNKVQKLLQTVKEQTGKSASRDYAYFMLLAMYGLRCSEVANLKISDIDWRKEQVYIKRAKNCQTTSVHHFYIM